MDKYVSIQHVRTKGTENANENRALFKDFGFLNRYIPPNRRQLAHDEINSAEANSTI